MSLICSNLMDNVVLQKSYRTFQKSRNSGTERQANSEKMQFVMGRHDVTRRSTVKNQDHSRYPVRREPVRFTEVQEKLSLKKIFIRSPRDVFNLHSFSNHYDSKYLYIKTTALFSMWHTDCNSLFGPCRYCAESQCKQTHYDWFFERLIAYEFGIIN